MAETGRIFKNPQEDDLWSSKNLGDIGILKSLFEASAKGLELHKENAAFIKAAYEFNRTLVFAKVDPLFAALDKIFQEILKLLDDLRGLGFYYLPVHSKSIGTSNEVQRNPVTGGLLIGGTYYAKATASGIPGEYKKANIFRGDTPATDKETGEQIYVKDTAWEDPFDADGNSTGAKLTFRNAFVYANEKLGLTQLSPTGILQTIDRSFDDKNDVPKGNTAFTTDTSQLLSEDYYLSGRPIFSNSATVGGIIIIMGAPSFDKFGDILKTFNKFIDLESFNKLVADVEKILNPPAVHRIKLSWVSTKTIDVDSESPDFNTPPSLSDAPGKKTYIEKDDSKGSFYKHDKNEDGTYKSNRVLKATVGKSIARVTKVITTENMVIEDRETLGHKADTHNTPLTETMIKRNHQEIKIDRNLVPYQNQELEIAYMSPGMEFKKGDIIVEAIPMTDSGGTQTATGDKIDLNKQNAGDPGKDNDKEYVQVTEGELIVGKVVDEFYADALPEKPDWRGKRLEELIPPLGSVLDTTETHVRSIFATIKNYQACIDPIIKYLDGKMDELTAFSNEIEELLELFAVGIPATGIYTLYLNPQLGGTARFRERMMGAGGPDKPPENLKFCAGVCFLGGGPAKGPLVKSLDFFALMLGMREQTAAEAEQQKALEELALHNFDETKTYMAGDKIYYKGVNYICLVNYTTGEEPIIFEIPNFKAVINAAYWERLGEAGEEVTVGDARTPEEIRKAKINFLKDTKKALGDILVKLNGASPGASSLRKKIMDVPLYGAMDPLQSPPAFISSGANEATFNDLLNLRDIDLEELDLLVYRITEMLVSVEITMIQETPDVDTEPGSFRSKGKSLLILKGEFIDEVDDFEGGQRKVKPNTTITILDPLNPGSGSTRTVERMSNTTVAVLNEPFEPDIETALAYDVILTDQNETEYKYKSEYRANNTHYYHPGYRLREFEAKANTISTYSKVDVAGNYIDIPEYEAGNPKGSGFDNKPRNVNEYPLGTIIEINGTVPQSEGYVGGGGIEVLLEEEEQVAETWNAIGVSQDDILIVTLDTGVFTKYIQEVLDDTHIAINSAIQAGGDAPYQTLLYHSDWDFELSIGKKQVKAQDDKIQGSKNKFLDYLNDINAQADEIYDYLDKLNNEGW